MADSTQSASPKAAYVSHLIMAGIAGIGLLSTMDLEKDSPDVAGGLMFLLIVYLGLPAIVVSITALVLSVKSGALSLVGLTALLLALWAALFVSNAPTLIRSIGVVYVLLVGLVGVLLQRAGRISLGPTSARTD